MTKRVALAVANAIAAAKAELAKEGICLDEVRLTLDLSPELYNDFRRTAQPHEVGLMRVLDRRRGQYEIEYRGAIVDADPLLDRWHNRGRF